MASLCWHYRNASDPAQVTLALKKLHAELAQVVGEASLRVLSGNMVLEVQAGGIDKGASVLEWLNPQHTFTLAAGDDITDEDLFRALPPDAFTIKVGEGESEATLHVTDPDAMLDLLQTLLGST